VTPSLLDDVGAAMARIAEITGAAFEWGPPAEGPARLGEITVAVGTEAPCPPGWGGCTAYASLRASGDPAADDHLDAADVVVSPAIVGSGYQLGIVLHEMGHAVGLAHFDDAVDGRVQTMAANQLPGVADYGPGDVAGLVDLARHGFLADATPVGALQALRRTAGGVQVEGWAYDRDLGTDPATVLVTADGRVVADLGAALPGADVAAGPAAVVGTSHRFSATVAAPDRPVEVCVTVLDAVRGNGPTTLGCRLV
jgi:hypothetical protein